MSATPVSKDTYDDEGPQLSKGAAVFVMIIAFAGMVLATIDMFVNGWLSALAHLGWAIGVFLVIALVLGLVLALVLGSREAAEYETPAESP
ncbi:hypothetical protein ACFC0S_16275 [Streptomyces sp. NPDC056084]|uniref:hypothetical protein n=1 Tax=unclassified Streptomyces TaxID=2593676 RepID=UPI0035D85E6E